MAIDFDKLKKRLDDLKNGGTKKENTSFWKPEFGKHEIRLLPTPDKDPLKNYHFHYNMGAYGGFLCPKRNFDEGCPVCDFASKVWFKASEDDSYEDKELAKSLFTRERFFANVLVRGEEEKGPRLWGFSKTVYEQLLNIFLNPDYGDITDPEEGTDLVMTYEKKDGARFPSTFLQPKRKVTKLAKDKKEIAKLLDAVKDPLKEFNRLTTAEVKDALEKWSSAAAAEAKDDLDDLDYKESKKKESGDTDDIDESFKEMLGE